MKNRTIREPALAPYWKRRLPKHPEHKEWKRDRDGYPIFHEDGVCKDCKGEAKKFSRPWYAFKYQILGYCEACTIKKMGVAPTPEQEAAYERSLKKPARFYAILPPDTEAVAELERLSNAL